MSIVYHEGLPGAGKSYEACAFHIIPALKAGRRVVTNIEGINHSKFAELTDIPEPFIKQNLICIDHQDISDTEEKYAEQKRSLLELSGNDSLIVIDEIQDMFPSQRQKLETEWSRYIGSHRHDGNDIILMGQSIKDTHTFWRRRVQRKIVFTKQTALGKDSSYLWQAYEATTPEVFKKVASGSRKYDSKYFGLYETVTASTTNTNLYADKRTVIWNTPLFKYVIPACVVIAFYSISHLIGMFTTPQVQASEVKIEEPEKPQLNHKEAHAAAVAAAQANLQNQTSTELNSIEEEPEYIPIDTFDDYANRYRPRLAGVIEMRDRFIAEVEILDSSFHRKDVYTSEELVDMGWELELRISGLYMQKEGVEHLVRSWPVDAWGAVNNGTVASFSKPSAASLGTPRNVDYRQATYIPETKRERMVARPSRVEDRRNNSG